MSDDLMDDDIYVAVSPDVARLLTPEIVAALPALLRVAWTEHEYMPSAERPSMPHPVVRAHTAVPHATWAALGEVVGADDA